MEKEYCKGLLLDFAGVLVYDGFASLKRYADKYGIDPEKLDASKKEAWKRFRIDPGMTSTEFWKECLDNAGFQPDGKSISEINESVLESHYPFTCIFEFSENLKECGVRTGIITNTSREWFEHFNEKFRLSGRFPVIVKSYEVGVPKPGQGIFDSAREKMGIPRKDTLFVDDQQVNVEAGIKYGYVNSLPFKSHLHTIEKMSEYFGCMK